VVFSRQEVAGVFVERAAGTTVGEKWHVLAPAKLDSKRDQNSMLLLSKAKFPDVASVREVTADVCTGFDKSVPVADGDVFAVTVTDKAGDKYLLVSFHGDTDGLATIPVTAAVRATHKLLGDEYTCALCPLPVSLSLSVYPCLQCPHACQRIALWGRLAAAHRPLASLSSVHWETCT